MLNLNSNEGCQVIDTFSFCLTASEEMIAQDETYNNNQDGKKAAADKQHNCHAHSNPEKNKSDHTLHSCLISWSAGNTKIQPETAQGDVEL